MTWNQKNATRIGGAGDSETARYVLQIAYPATGADNRPGSIINVADDWRTALAVTPLVARPTSAAVIIRGEAGDGREVDRLRATGVADDTIAGEDAATLAAAVDERGRQAASRPP